MGELVQERNDLSNTNSTSNLCVTSGTQISVNRDLRAGLSSRLPKSDDKVRQVYDNNMIRYENNMKQHLHLYLRDLKQHSPPPGFIVANTRKCSSALTSLLKL